MTKQDEISTSRAIERIYQDCPQQVAFYARRKRMFLVIACLLTFVALALGSFELVSGRLGLVIEVLIAVLGGCAVGLAALFSTAANRIPFLERYSAPQVDEIRKRLEELENA
jgi:hypothetical protein